jgi:hypothetical protein
MLNSVEIQLRIAKLFPIYATDKKHGTGIDS